MFTKSIIIFMPIFTYKYLILFYISSGIFLSVSVWCSCVFTLRTDVKNTIFPIPIAYWSGFRIFKQDRENPDEIRMVGQFGLANLVVISLPATLTPT